MKILRLLFSSFVVAGAVLSSPRIFAQGNSNTLPATQPGSQAIERIQERLDNREEAIGKMLENRCERLTARIQSRIQNFETNRERHRERYQFLSGRLSDIAARLKAKGYDTAALEAHLQEFDGMVGNYEREYAEFIEALKLTVNFACGQSEGAFADALAGSHQKLQLARQTRVEIRNYYRNVIRVDIGDLRNQ